MDSIKKKMIAMKMEKENAQDRAEQLEQQLRDTEEQKAKVRLKTPNRRLIRHLRTNDPVSATNDAVYCIET